MTFSHEQKSDTLQRLALSITKSESLALLFGHLHNDARKRKGLYHINLRLGRYDRVGLHVTIPPELAEDIDLHAGYDVIILATMTTIKPGSKGPNPRFRAVMVEVSV